MNHIYHSKKLPGTRIQTGSTTVIGQTKHADLNGGLVTLIHSSSFIFVQSVLIPTACMAAINLNTQRLHTQTHARIQGAL